MMSWSKLEGTALWAAAEVLYNEPVRSYHNMNHIRAMYEHAERLGFEYDMILDLAILGHDVIYDAEPDKEARSVEWLYEQIAAVGWSWHGKIEQLIMSTEKHEVGRYRDNRLIMLDLADLADPMRRIVNYKRIMAESCDLYGIDEKTFAEANMQFMKRLSGNFVPEKVVMGSIGYYDFWDAVLEGCWYCVNESARILDRG